MIMRTNPDMDCMVHKATKKGNCRPSQPHFRFNDNGGRGSAGRAWHRSPGSETNRANVECGCGRDNVAIHTIKNNGAMGSGGWLTDKAAAGNGVEFLPGKSLHALAFISTLSQEEQKINQHMK